MESLSTGKFYICATPIGNLDDITIRGLNTLKEVDLIAAEDTRHTRKLLSHYNIHKPLTSYHEFSNEKKSNYILQHIKDGKDVALVSDAGMPGICDPGYEIINLMIDNNITVIPIPGVSALTAALAVSGFEMSKFVFEGFLPKKKTERKRLFIKLKDEKRTIIFYESPHRIKDTLNIMLNTLGNRRIVICREITKKFEEISRGLLSEIIDRKKEQEIKGELTIVLEGFQSNDNGVEVKLEEDALEEIKKKMKNYLKKGYYNKDIVKLITQEYDIQKNWVYQNIIKIKNSINQ